MDPNRNQRSNNGSGTNGNGNNPPVTKTVKTATTKITALKPAPVQAARATNTSTATASSTATNSTATNSTATNSTSATNTRTVTHRPAQTTATNNAQTSGRQNVTRSAAGAEGSARTQPRATAASTNTNATASTSGPRATASTAGAKKTAAAKTEDDPSLAYARRIAELAVQRAVLVTKTVLRSIPKKAPAGPNAPLSQKQNAGTTDGTSAAKKDNSPVTIADFAVQALLISGMRKAFPNYGFLGEETAGKLREDERMREKVWKLVQKTKLSDPACEALLGKPGGPQEMMDIIDIGASKTNAEPNKKYIIMDPVDGTSAFMEHGQYAVVLGMVENGHEIMGVVAGPNVKFDDVVLGGAKIREFDTDEDGLGTMISAVRGYGATARPVGPGELLPAVPLNRASQPPPKLDKTKPGLAKFYGLKYVDSENSPKSRWDKVQDFAGGPDKYKKALQLYSSHVRYMAMALGDRTYTQIRWPDERKKPFKPWSIWDHVGTPLIYTESGPSKVTDLHGKPLTYNEGRDMLSYYGIITADATIHKAIVDAVKVELAAEQKLVAAKKLTAAKK